MNFSFLVKFPVAKSIGIYIHVIMIAIGFKDSRISFDNSKINFCSKHAQHGFQQYASPNAAAASTYGNATIHV